MFTIVTENDESNWNDRTGELYHYPKRYLKYLSPGTKIIYYKGKIKNKKYYTSRLSDEPHYFGVAEIKNQYKDTNSSKNDYYSEIINYQRFDAPIIAKIRNQYLEKIPEHLKANYWRNAVRPIEEGAFLQILSYANIIADLEALVDDQNAYVTAAKEGNKTVKYGTTYERNGRLRNDAIKIHGTTCMACGFNFENTYGGRGRGFIHVHHIKPLSETGVQVVDPITDLIVLCPNCHSIVHRKRSAILTLEELRSIIKG